MQPTHVSNGDVDLSRFSTMGQEHVFRDVVDPFDQTVPVLVFHADTIVHGGCACVCGTVDADTVAGGETCAMGSGRLGGVSGGVDCRHVDGARGRPRAMT